MSHQRVKCCLRIAPEEKKFHGYMCVGRKTQKNKEGKDNYQGLFTT